MDVNIQVAYFMSNTCRAAVYLGVQVQRLLHWLYVCSLEPTQVGYEEDFVEGKD